MSTFVRLLSVVCICAIAPALAGPAPAEPEQPASQSSAPAAPNAASQTAEPSATTNAVSTTPATSEKTSTTQSSNAATASKVVLVDKTMTDAQVKQLLAKGYKPQAQGGEVLYCRREPVLGTHFEHKICRSAEQLMRDEHDAKEMAERMQQPMGSPAGK